MRCYGFNVAVWIEGDALLAQSPEMPTRRYTGELVRQLEDPVDAVPGACWVEDATVEPRFLYVDEALAIRAVPLAALVADGVMGADAVDCSGCGGCAP